MVLAANRDEFLDRATAPLSYWQDYKGVLAGRDLQANGTWLGIGDEGRIGAITNYREPVSVQNAYITRGEILSDFLKGDLCAKSFVQGITAKAERYRGFNLLVGDRKGLYYTSNRASKNKEIKPGIYGLSNHLLDSDWPKVERGKKLFTRVTGKNPLRVDDLFTLLTDVYHPPEALLPDTGVGSSWEKLLSPIFISSPVYGTRSSAVITIADNGDMDFWERVFQHESGGWHITDDQHYFISSG